MFFFFVFAFSIHGHGGHLGHTRTVNSTVLNTLSVCNPLKLKALQQTMFESINLTDLGQRSNNDLDLWHSCVIMYSLSQQLVI